MHSNYTLKDQKRFWTKVAISDDLEVCWEWQAGKFPGGYGKMWWKNEMYAHRIAYLLTYGDLKGLWVLHKCDNPSCCNPTHLFLGTKFDNMKDRDRKGRMAKGERASNVKLTASKVIAIRKLYSEGVKVRALAEQYCVTGRAIYCVVRRKTWKHI